MAATRFSPQTLLLLFHKETFVVHVGAGGGNGKCFSPSQSSKDVPDIRVVSARLGDGHSQLCVAERTDGRDEACADPHHDGDAHRARVLQNPLRTDENPGSNDVP